MDINGWAAITGTGAAVLAFALLGFSHWATMRILGPEPHVLVRYTVGCGAILLILGAWCAVQPETVPALWAWLAAVGITVGAGLGTAAAHWLDDWDGMRKERAIRNGQQRAKTDRNL